MSSNFAIVGAGSIGTWIIDELLNYKASGAVNTLRVLSRSVSLYHYLPAPVGRGTFPGYPANESPLFHLTGNPQIYQPRMVRQGG